jgi:P27 family predicted phage terminase small subunit
MAGPAKPLALKKLNGSWRGTYGFDEDAMNPPDAEGELLMPPSWLRSKAKATWMGMCRELREIGMLKTTDLHALAVYCEAWGEYVTLCEECWGEDRTVNGRVNPLFALKDMVFKRWVKMASEFGMTPSARMRVQMSATTAR